MSSFCPIAFIETKAPDLAALAEILAPSVAVNHFTNFGPVSRQLETTLLDVMGLPAGPDAPLQASVCASGTTALTAAAGALSLKAGRPLRWVVSAFGFFSTNTGVFSDATVVDCDGAGLIDLDAVSRLPDDAWDGLVFTNLFGLVDDLEPLFTFCAERGKALILDHAASLGCLWDLYRSPAAAAASWIETFSFHQTKPWGMGEGGGAIMAPGLKPLFEGCLNFGVGQDPAFAPYFSNGKISEIACSVILGRLRSLPEWRQAYRAQAERILDLGRKAGLTPQLPQIPGTSVPGQVPLLSSRIVPFEELANPHLVLRKYYTPFRGHFPIAGDVYNRVVNVPCHPGVAALSDAQLIALLERFA